jgi:hypothetical protein
MYDGVYPLELYRDYGISSYNIAYAGERIAMSYYSLMDAIKALDDIKLVVIDMHGLEYGDQKNDPEAPERCHNTFDAMHFSTIKIEAIKDCVDKDLWAEFFFPLSFYHNRWTELTEADIQKSGSKRELAKGGCYEIGVANVSAPELIGITDHEFVQDASTTYMQKIIDLCADNDIQVLMIYIPFPASIEDQQRANMAYDMAQNNENAEYVNFLYEADNIGINYATDTADSSSHLNPSGARKFTRYLGKYIMDNYDLTDYSGDAKWDTAYEKYMSEVKDGYFAEISDIYTYLMLCADEDYYCEFYYADEAIWSDDILIQELLLNIAESGSISIYTTDSSNEDTSVIIKVMRSKNGNLVDNSSWNANGKRQS